MVKVKFVNSSLAFATREIPEYEDVTSSFTKSQGRIESTGYVYTNESYVLNLDISSLSLKKFQFKNMSVNGRVTEYFYRASDSDGNIIADYSLKTSAANATKDDSGVITFPSNTKMIMLMNRNARESDATTAMQVIRYNR